MRFLLGEGDVLCIDWDDRSLRVVEASAGRGGVKVRAAIHVPLEPGVSAREPASLGEFIRRTLSEHRMRARRAIVDVPRQDAVLNLLSLPPGTQDELAAMIHIQIAKELPFSKDQTVIDFAVLPKAADAASLDVWVTAVRNNVVDYYRQVMTAAGLKLERIGLRPYANMAAVNAMGVEQTGRTLLVDIGPSLTEIDVFRDGRLAYSRAATVSVPEDGLSSNRPVSAVPPAAEDAAVPPVEAALHRPPAMDSLLVEVNRTIGAYRATDPAAKIDRIILAGTARLNEAILRAFQDRFGAPAQAFDLPANLKWHGAKGVDAVPYSAALGLALSQAGDSLQVFNLLAPKEPEDERRERIRRVPYKAAILVSLLAVSAAAAYYPLYQRSAKVAELKADIARLNKNKPDRDELKNFVGLTQDWEGRNRLWIDDFKRIADVFPKTDTVYITKVDCRDNDEIVLDIFAKDEFQADVIARLVNEIKGEKGQQLYSAKIGIVPQDSREPAFPVLDHVIIQRRPGVSPLPDAKPETRPAGRTETRPATGTDMRSEVRPERRPDMRPETRPAPGTETRSGRRSEVRPETPLSPGAEPRTGRRSEMRPDGRSGRQPETRPVTGSEMRSGRRSEIRSDGRPEMRPDGRPEMRPSTQPSRGLRR